jgi:two-component system CheB/CheR fusion protein
MTKRDNDMLLPDAPGHEAGSAAPRLEPQLETPESADDTAAEGGDESWLDGGAELPPGLDELLRYLHESRGFDFAGYKRTGLARRLSKRVQLLGLRTFTEYVDYLQVYPDEFAQLFNAILINATGFFRDPVAWEFIEHDVIPALIASKRTAAPLRIWSAGCATGQEAYTIAMLFAEALGPEAFSRSVKIYATDIDDDALGLARQATYTAKEVSGVRPTFLVKHFEQIGDRYSFSKELRRSVIFGRHNLLNDAPISRIDLLLCRNTLMYFNADAQGRILSSLHFALADGGVLFLGKAEMLLAPSSLFTPIDLKRRLFAKISPEFGRARASSVLSAPLRDQERSQLGGLARMWETAFACAPVPQLGIDTRGMLTIMNEQARRVLGVQSFEIGRLVQDMALCRKVAGLRPSVEQTISEGRSVQLTASEWPRGGGEDSLYFDILSVPLVDEGGVRHGVQVSFIDVTAAHRLQDELEQRTQELEAAYEELQSTSEELETTNEELQSTVEELETTNEELQSTNEELETTNEELQSTNEELQSMNAELRQRTGDLGRVNSYFESILASLRSAVVVLDMDLQVQVWSDRAQDLWGLRADEVQHKHFLGLDIGLPVEQLLQPIRTALTSGCEYETIVLSAMNRRGRLIQCHCMVSRLTQDDDVRGVVLLMEEREVQRAAPQRDDVIEPGG